MTTHATAGVYRLLIRRVDPATGESATEAETIIGDEIRWHNLFARIPGLTGQDSESGLVLDKVAPDGRIVDDKSVRPESVATLTGAHLL